jgi:hypothetical protein
VVWLAQSRTEELEQAARRAAALLGLPMEILDAGESGLEQQLERLVAA